MLNKVFKFNWTLILSLLLVSGAGGGNSENNDGTTTFSVYDIDWTNKSDTASLPQGIELFSTRIESINSSVHYLKLDLLNEALELRAVSLPQSKNLNDYVKATGAIAAINGGYFSGNRSDSAVVDSFTYFAHNINSLNRNSKAYPVLRSGLTISANNDVEVNWIYQFDQSGEVYKFSSPLPYSMNDVNPLTAPTKAEGTAFMPKLVIGGGPTLVKNGQVNITYAEEVFWGSGVELNDFRPRTAVCLTAEQHLLMIVATHYKISALPELLISLGCESAMNLDGGGSSAMALASNDIYNQNRAVPSALVIVDKNNYEQ